jgi:ribosomal protein S6
MTDSIELESGSDTLRVYEVGYLLLSSIPEEKVPDEVSRIKSFITSAGGTMISGENPEMRPLAYQMEKHIATRNERFDSAYFGWMTFEAAPALAVALKAELDGMESVLRFLIMKTVREVAVAPKKAPKEVVLEDSAEIVDEAVTASGEEIDKEIEGLVLE